MCPCKQHSLHVCPLTKERGSEWSARTRLKPEPATAFKQSIKQRRWRNGMVGEYTEEKVETALTKWIEREGLFVCLCLCLNLSVVYFVGRQQHDWGLTLLWWQLLATVEKTDQFGFSSQHSPAMPPMSPHKHSAAWQHGRGWRATKETNCSFSKRGL